MRKSLRAALLCILFAATLLMAGCSSSGTTSQAGDGAGKGQEVSGGQLEESEAVPEEDILAGSDSLLSEGEAEEEIEAEPEEETVEEPEGEVKTEPEGKTAAVTEKKPAASGAGADGSISAADDGQGTEKAAATEEKEPEKAGTEEDKIEEDKIEEDREEEITEEGRTEKDKAKEDKEEKEDKEKEEKEKEVREKEDKEKEENDILKDLQAGLEGEYIPDGFEPEGNYVLIYDSGYTVKTRYSKVGLTYYWGSEEFFFRLNKDLPDMKAYVAHMLFNTAEPMTDSGEEVFPYDESYVLYIDLDNGNSYQVAKYSLDRTGRIFVRELFESFRQRWEGTF